MRAHRNGTVGTAMTGIPLRYEEYNAICLAAIASTVHGFGVSAWSLRLRALGFRDLGLRGVLGLSSGGTQGWLSFRVGFTV